MKSKYLKIYCTDNKWYIGINRKTPVDLWDQTKNLGRLFNSLIELDSALTACGFVRTGREITQTGSVKEPSEDVTLGKLLTFRPRSPPKGK